MSRHGSGPVLHLWFFVGSVGWSKHSTFWELMGYCSCIKNPINRISVEKHLKSWKWTVAMWIQELPINKTVLSVLRRDLSGSYSPWKHALTVKFARIFDSVEPLLPLRLNNFGAPKHYLFAFICFSGARNRIIEQYETQSFSFFLVKPFSRTSENNSHCRLKKPYQKQFPGLFPEWENSFKNNKWKALTRISGAKTGQHCQPYFSSLNSNTSQFHNNKNYYFE